MKLKYAACCALLLAGANAMACYTVYDSGGRVLYNGAEAPVDMRLQLHEALSVRGYPAGSRLVFDQTSSCSSMTLASLLPPAGGNVPLNTMRIERPAGTVARGTPSPLFTDRATARSAHLPNVQVAGNIVMVPPEAADRAMRPTVTVLPATTFVATSAPGAPDTRALGAGSARHAGAPVPLTRKQVVITELRDPPMTIVSEGR